MPTQRILVIGAGPVRMGHGLEYGVATDEACRALNEKGYTLIVLDNRTSAMTPDLYPHAAVYCEPLTHDVFDQVLARERPHAVLATAGGAPALHFILQRHYPGAVAGPCPTLFGPSAELLAATHDMETLRKVAESVGADAPQSSCVMNQRQGEDYAQQIGFPVIVQPRYCHGGVGTTIAYTQDEVARAVQIALSVSPIRHADITQSLYGMKRTEWVVLRDTRGTLHVVGGMEYIEPMGIHTADSPAVTPIQSLSEKTLAACKECICHATEKLALYGAVTFQLAHCYATGKMYIVSVEPYITRAALWVGRATHTDVVAHHIDCCESTPLDISGLTHAYPPTDFFTDEDRPTPSCWCRMPLFPGTRLFPSRDTLTTYSKSIGAVCGVGEDFLSAFFQAVYAAHASPLGPSFSVQDNDISSEERDTHTAAMRLTPHRLWHVYRALQSGVALEELHHTTHIDPWFLEELVRARELQETWDAIPSGNFQTHTETYRAQFAAAKCAGCPDAQLARALGTDVARIADCRRELALLAGPRLLSHDDDATRRVTLTYAPGPRTQYLAHEAEETLLFLDTAESLVRHGPTHAYIIARMAAACHAHGARAILLSPDPLHSAAALGMPLRHYIVPVTPESLSHLLALERPCGVITHMDTDDIEPLASVLDMYDVPLLGASLDARRRIAHRERFHTLLQKLDIRQPPHAVAKNAQDVYITARDIGYPVMVHPARPSTVPRVAIWYDEDDARAFLHRAKSVSEIYPLSIESFIDTGKEYHIEAISDGTHVAIVGILEHVEEAGVHTADSAAFWPHRTLPAPIIETCKRYLTRIVEEVDVRGMISITVVVVDTTVYLLSVTPHASRSSAFMHMTTGRTFIPNALAMMRGETLQGGARDECTGSFIAVRTPVFPFARFPFSDASLGPEHYSIGEAVGVNTTFGTALAKAFTASGGIIPTRGVALLSLTDRDKGNAVALARQLRTLGFSLVATRGTAQALAAEGITATSVLKIHEGHPNALDYLCEGKIQLIINTPSGKEDRADEASLRHEALQRGLPVLTTVAGARAFIEGIQSFMRHGTLVRAMSEHTATLVHQRELKLDDSLLP